LKGLLVAMLCVAAAVFYVPLRFHTLSGDDFTAYHLLQASRTEGLLRLAFVKDVVGWFRPASMILVVERASLHGTDAELYFYGNLLLAVATATLLFLVAARQSRSLLIAGSLALLLLYHQSHFYLLIGLAGIDLVANLVFIVFLAIFLVFLRGRSARAYFASCAAYAVLLLWRENFVFLSLPLAAAAFLTNDERSPFRSTKAWAGAATALAVTSIYLLGRTHYLSGHSASVPGAEIGLHPLAILRSYGIFLLDLPGIYLNEEWFIGIRAARVAWTIKLLQAAFLIGSTLALCVHFRNRQVERRTKLESAFLAAFVLVLLVPGALIHKHDPRYVAPSLMAYLILLARAMPVSVGHQAGAAVAAAALAAYAMTTGVYFRRYMDNLYFVSANKIAANVKTLTIDRFGQSLRAYRIAIPASSELGYPLHWGLFFCAYLDDPAYQVVQYKNLDEIEIPDPKPLLILGCGAGTCIDVTAPLQEARADRDRLRFDLIHEFGNGGTIEPDTAVSTPTGRGVFAGASEDELGRHPSLTLVSGFHYRVPARAIEPGDELCLRYHMPYVRSDGAGLRIKAVAPGAAEAIVFDDAGLKPRPGWDRKCVALSPIARRRVQLDLEVYSPSGDSTADWVTFTQLAVLRAPRTMPATPPLDGEVVTSPSGVPPR